MKLLIVSIIIVIGVLIYRQSVPGDKPEPQPATAPGARYTIPENDPLLREALAGGRLLESSSAAADVGGSGTTRTRGRSGQSDALMSDTIALIRLQSRIKVPLEIEDFSTLDGRLYQHVTVTRIEPDGISFRHASGGAKLGLKLLPPEMAEKYHIRKETADTYAGEIERRRQVAALADAEQKARSRENDVQENSLREKQGAAIQQQQLARESELQRINAIAYWVHYEADMRDYEMKTSAVEIRRSQNPNLIVKMPVKPVPPSVADPR